MRVRLITTDRDPFWLIGNPAKNERDQMSQAYEESIQVTRNMQEQTGAEWDARSFFDRGNQRVTFDATVRRQFANEVERMDFLARLAAINTADQEHLWEGDVWLRTDKRSDTPGEFKEWLLPNAVIALGGTKLDAECGLRLSYRIMAGGFGSETREGTSGVALLIVNSGGGVGFEITAAQLQAFVDAHIGPSTTRFYLNLTMRLPDSPYSTSASVDIVPAGTGGGAAEFELPVASSISAIAAYLHSHLSTHGGSVTESGGTMRMIGVSQDEPANLNDWMLIHRYLDESMIEQDGDYTFGAGVDLAFDPARLLINNGSAENLLTLVTET